MTFKIITTQEIRGNISFLCATSNNFITIYSTFCSRVYNYDNKVNSLRIGGLVEIILFFVANDINFCNEVQVYRNTEKYVAIRSTNCKKNILVVAITHFSCV